MDGSLELPDGRTLGYAVTGDLDGPPVVYCHGWPASRLEATLARDLPARLIAIDRPGYGRSSPHRGRRLSDFATDVERIADRLGLGAVHVVGVSGGAPYAVACAALLPRVAGAALISAVPPSIGPAAGSSSEFGQSLRRLFAMGRRRRAGWATMAAARLAIRASLLRLERVLDGGLSQADRSALTPDMRARLIGAWREGLRPGVEGAVSDARIYGRPWGVKITDVAVPVEVWHGEEDQIVPVGTMEAFAALPLGRFRRVAGEGHYSLALTRARDVLLAMLGREERRSR